MMIGGRHVPPRSIRWRLGLLYGLLLGVMLAVTLGVIGIFAERALLDSTVSRLEIEAGLLTANTGGRNGVTATDLAAGDLANVLGGDGTAVTIIDPGGTTLAAEPNGTSDAVAGARLTASEYQSVLSGGSSIDAVRTAADGSARVLVVAAPVELRLPGDPVQTGRPADKGPPPGRGLGNQKPGKSAAPGQQPGPPNAVAQLSVSLAPVDATLRDLRNSLVASGFVIFGIGIGLAWLLTGLGLRPLGRIAGAADRITAGDLSARAGLPEGNDEIGRLGRAFDDMVEQVEATLRSQRQFAADASHELRSPLTVLGGYVDVLAREPLAASEAGQRALAAMRREIDRLSRLAADLLLLTHLEAGGRQVERRDVDLGELVEGVAEATRVMAPGRHVESHRNGMLPVRADPDRLTQAVMNLVDNALRHAPADGRIELSTRADDGFAVAAVTNGGVPIPAEHLPHLFERFYRVATTEDTDSRSPHAGLGLSIVRAIVTASGGEVTVASDERSTRFEIRLPLATPPSEQANQRLGRAGAGSPVDGPAPAPAARSIDG
jgi:two-component system OmpR family sensor kinase